MIYKVTNASEIERGSIWGHSLPFLESPSRHEITLLSHSTQFDVSVRDKQRYSKPCVTQYCDLFAMR